MNGQLTFGWSIIQKVWLVIEWLTIHQVSTLFSILITLTFSISLRKKNRVSCPPHSSIFPFGRIQISYLIPFLEPETIEDHVEDNHRLAEPAEDPQPGIVDTHEPRCLYLGGEHLRFNFKFNFKMSLTTESLHRS